MSSRCVEQARHVTRRTSRAISPLATWRECSPSPYEGERGLTRPLPYSRPPSLAGPSLACAKGFASLRESPPEVACTGAMTKTAVPRNDRETIYIDHVTRLGYPYTYQGTDRIYNGHCNYHLDVHKVNTISFEEQRKTYGEQVAAHW